VTENVSAPCKSSLCHLGNLGYQQRRKLTWDPAKEEFPGDAEARALTTRKPRDGWKNL
jgi:hypothetical protein